MGVFKNSITSQLLFQEVVLKCRILGHADGTASLPIYRNERRYFDSNAYLRFVSATTVIVVIFGLMIITLIIVCVRGACCCKYLRGGSGGRMPGYLGP